MKNWKIGWMMLFLVMGASCKTERNAQTKTSPREPITLNLFYVNDLAGELDLCGCPSHKMGGVARRAKYIQRFQALKENVIQVDAGNSFFPYRAPNLPLNEKDKEKAKVLAKSSARMKVDAINIGVSDLAGGLEFLNQLKEIAREQGELNLISSNLVNPETKKPVFPTEKILEFKGLKVGIFGVCRPSPVLGPKLEALDPKACIEEMVNKLKEKKKVDLIIGLFNLSLAESQKIAQEVPGIDFIIMSGFPQMLSNPVLENKTVLLQAGSGGKFLGHIELTYYGENKPLTLQKELEGIERQLERINAQLAEVAGKMAEDPMLKGRYAQLQREQGNYERKKKELQLLAFQYKYVLVPMSDTLPLDYQINDWVRQALDYDSAPAPSAH